MAPDPDLELRERGRGHAGFSSFCHFFIFCPIRGGGGGGGPGLEREGLV